jgi:imidazolonepropionase-like amidohydrolase
MTQPADLVLTGCTVVDGTGGPPIAGAAIRVADGRIAAIGAADGILADARRDAVDSVVDLAGAFVTAGLINMHTHLSLGLPGALGAALDRMTAHELVLYMADGARRTLEAGVTTVRCVAERDGADFALRSAIELGRAIGPRIFTAGRALVCTGGHGHGHGDTLECDGPAEFRKGARRQISLGADLIKVMISGGIAGEHEGIDTPQLQADELEAVITTAHDWGRKVTAHAGPAGVIDKAVRLGLDGVEHGYHLTGDVARLMAARNVALVPTLVVTRCGEFFEQLAVPCWMQQRSLSAGGRHLDSYRMALEAGVDVMLGSDMPPFWEFEGTTATVRELEWMIEGGLAPAAALRAATIAPARWLGVDADLGTVEVGKFADLVALRADPLEDASAWRTIGMVMKGGTIVRNDGWAS